MLLKWGIWIAFATAIQRAELLFFPENIAVVKELKNREKQLSNTNEEDLLNQASFHLSFQTQPTEDGPVFIPWISQLGVISNQSPSLPVCYDQPSNQKDVMVQLAHVICRQSGFVTATKWFGIRKETLGLHSNSSGLSAYCRGDEQFIDHCRWHFPILRPCSHFLAIECGDCSHSYVMAEETQITLASPGFPIYIPLVVCEWNITLLPENNLHIRFQQFELPSPIYDEAINVVSCRSGSLDIMSWHEDIKKMALDGRFCGRYSPGNLTIISNRILIRYTASSFKMDDVTKKGFLAECSLVSSAQLSSNFAIVRWVLTGSGILITVIIALFLWIWKGNFHNLYLRLCLNCCWANSIPTREGRLSLARSPLSAVVLPPPVETFSHIAGLEDQRMEIIHGRRISVTKELDQECDIRHWDQTRRLEKWHSTNRTTRSSSADFASMQKGMLLYGEYFTWICVCLRINTFSYMRFLILFYATGIELKDKISLVTTPKDRNGSHIYEEIDINLQNGCPEATCIRSVSSTAPPRMMMPFIGRSLFDRPPVMLYQQTSTFEPLNTTILVSGSSIPSHPEKSHECQLDHSVFHRPPCFHCRSSGSAFSTSSHLALSSESGDSASLSGIYVNPEPETDE
ncbi:uncharacterized protein LOC116917883 isoform X3 [Daphnia magna]|uniref:uncharacterized protein LOC116917883 isoform X3 n=1 Tax=Daphnia magna TaxID=35525 RepID=UPI001E1BA621|nr:uncharacterized protein LOC116917883 isoform X3 [Daphnia magna]